MKWVGLANAEKMRVQNSMGQNLSVFIRIQIKNTECSLSSLISQTKSAHNNKMNALLPWLKSSQNKKKKIN